MRKFVSLTKKMEDLVSFRGKDANIMERKPEIKTCFNVFFVIISFFSLLGLVFILIGFIFLILCGTHALEGVSFTLIGIFSILFGVFSISFYLIISCASSKKYVMLRSQNFNKEYALEYCKSMMNKNVQVEFEIECYHNKTNTFQRFDSEGRLQTEDHSEKIVTFQTTEELQFKFMEDRSVPLDLSSLPRFVHLQTSWEMLMDNQTYLFVQQKKNEFKERYKSVDAFFSFKENIYIDGVKDFSFSQNGEIPLFFEVPFCFISAICCWFFLFRIIFDHSFQSKDFHLIKFVSILPQDTKNQINKNSFLVTEVPPLPSNSDSSKREYTDQSPLLTETKKSSENLKIIQNK